MPRRRRGKKTLVGPIWPIRQVSPEHILRGAANMRPQHWDSIAIVAIAYRYRNTATVTGTEPWSAIPSRLRTPGILCSQSLPLSQSSAHPSSTDAIFDVADITVVGVVEGLGARHGSARDGIMTCSVITWYGGAR